MAARTKREIIRVIDMMVQSMGGGKYRLVVTYDTGEIETAAISAKAASLLMQKLPDGS